LVVASRRAIGLLKSKKIKDKSKKRIPINKFRGIKPILFLFLFTALRARQEAEGTYVNVMDYTDNGMPSALPCP